MNVPPGAITVDQDRNREFQEILEFAVTKMIELKDDYIKEQEAERQILLEQQELKKKQEEAQSESTQAQTEGGELQQQTEQQQPENEVPTKEEYCIKLPNLNKVKELVNEKIGEMKNQENIIIVYRKFEHLIDYFEFVANFIVSNDFSKGTTEQEIIQNTIQINKLKPFIHQKFVEYLLKGLNLDLTGFFQREDIQAKFNDILSFCLNEVVAFYKAGRQLVIENVDYFKEHTGTSQTNNKYVIIGQLKEISAQIYRQLAQFFQKQGVFQQNYDLKKRFSKFIIENFEIIETFSSEEQYDNIILPPRPTEPQKGDLSKELVEQKMEIVKAQYEIEKYTLHEVYNDERLCQGIMIKVEYPPEPIEEELDEEEEKKEEKPKKSKTKKFFGMFKKKDKKKEAEAAAEEEEKKEREQNPEENEAEEEEGEHKSESDVCKKPVAFILHKNLFGDHILVNSCFSGASWFLIELRQSVLEDRKSLLIDNSEDTVRNSKFFQNKKQTDALQDKDPKMFKRMQVDKAINIGQTFGYCLANINNYKNTQEFMKDFGKQAAINGTLAVVMSAIPVLKTLLIVGGLSMLTVSIYKNETLNKRSKWKKAGKQVLNVGTGIGGTLGGVALGQALIPIPVVGAVIGGIVGGFVGTKSSNTLMNALEKKSILKLISTIESQQDQKLGNWKYDDSYIHLFGVRRDYFEKSIPEEYANNKDDWLTLINYYFISLYYGSQDSKRQAAQEKKREEKLKKEEKEREKERKKLEKQMKKEGKTMQEETSDPVFLGIIDQVNKKEEEIKKMEQLEENQDVVQEWAKSITLVQTYIVEHGLISIKYAQTLESWVVTVINDKK